VRLGVLGGTFDPIHIGHLALAKTAQGSLSLDQVLFVPAGNPWFKSEIQPSPAHHRLKMVKLAALSSGRTFASSAMEVDRPGPSYTVDTLEELRRLYGRETELFVLLGIDALNELARWRTPEGVLSMATPVAMARPGHRCVDAAALEAIHQGAAARVVKIDGPAVGVSGTEIRERVYRRKSIARLVPTTVEEYIQEHRLYMDTTGRVEQRQ